MKENLHHLGYAAAALTTLSFVPQVIRAWRSRSTHDLSPGWLLTFSTGLALWLVYGFVIGEWPVILANAVTLGLTLALFVMKLKFG